MLTRHIKIIGLLGSFACQHGLALSLGSVETISYLDEPLKANIEILGVESAAESSVLVLPASDEELAQLNLQPQSVLETLRVEVVKMPSGKWVAGLSTTTAVETAQLNLVLRAQSNAGEIVQKYTLLLQDPPEPLKAVEREQIFNAAQGDLEMLEVELSDQTTAVRDIEADSKQNNGVVAQNDVARPDTNNIEEPYIVQPYTGVLTLGSAARSEFPLKNKMRGNQVQSEALQSSVDDIVRRLANVLDRLRDANEVIGSQQAEIDQLNATIVNLNHTIDAENKAKAELQQLVSEFHRRDRATASLVSEPRNESELSESSFKAIVSAALAAFFAAFAARLGFSRWRQARTQTEEYNPLSEEMSEFERRQLAAADTAACVNDGGSDTAVGLSEKTDDETSIEANVETGIAVLGKAELIGGNEQLIDEVASEFDELAPLAWNPPAANDDGQPSIDAAKIHIARGEFQKAHSVLSAIMTDDQSGDHRRACKLLISIEASV